MTKEVYDLSIFHDISQLIESAKFHFENYANSALVLIYWQIGLRINQDFLKNERAEYGIQLTRELAKLQTSQYDSGFDYHNLTRMVWFSKLYPDRQIVVTVSQQLFWSHLIRLISIRKRET